MAAIERRQRKAYLGELRAMIDTLSEGWRESSLQRSEVATLRGVVAASSGEAPAKFRDDVDAHFFANAVSRFEALADTIDELQEELREARAVRRSYSVVTNHLLQAERAGLNTPEGRRRVKDAHAEALDPTPNKEWDW